MKEMRSINNKLGCTVLCAIMLVWLSACMSTETANLEQELASATDRNSDLEKHLAQYKSIEEKDATLKDKQKTFENHIINDLMAHPELIPYSGAVGGTPFFFEAEIMGGWKEGKTYGFVYARAEDGHWDAELIYYFIIDENNAIIWKLVASDNGGNYSAYTE